MAIAQGKPVTINDVLNIVSEEDIAYFYLGITHLPTVICNPYRKDIHPSLGLRYSSTNHITYKDFATGEQGSLFLLLMNGLSLSFNELLQNIYENLIVNHKSANISIASSNPVVRKAKASKITDIQVTVRPWKPWDKEYWSSFGITKKFLKFGNVVPISHIFFIKDNLTYFHMPADKYAYAYIENKDNKITLKIYQPYSVEYKWINKHSSDVWDLWEQLPEKGDTLIITSSRKDALCIWCNTGIPACSLQAESYLPKQSVIDELKQRFTNVFVLYDNDFTKSKNHGREYGALLANTFNLRQIELPEALGAKDSSDLFKLHGKQILRDTIFTLIKNET